MAISIFPADATTPAVVMPLPPQRYKWRLARTPNVKAIIVGHLVTLADLYYSGAVSPWPVGYLEKRPSFGESDVGSIGRWERVEHDASAQVEQLKDYHPGFLE